MERLKEWPNPADWLRQYGEKKPYLDPKEFHDFYEIPASAVLEDRPYTWYMVVHSNGIIALDEDSSPQHIALAHLKYQIPETAGAIADWRALQYGWAFADAVLGGAEIPRKEAHVTWNVLDDDLQRHRSQLGREYAQPIKVVLTRRAEPEKFNLMHPVFHQGTAVVFTSETGEKSLYKQMDALSDPPKKLKVYALGKDSVEDYAEMMRILRQEHNVRFLDVQGGGQTARQLLDVGLVDEYRETLPPTEFGMFYADGKTPRPSAWGNMSRNKDNSTIWRDIQLRLAGNHILVRKRGPINRNDNYAA